MTFLTHAIIPARKGSKGFPNKNISLFNGKPLLAWSVQFAFSCSLIDNVYITTDSTEYESIAMELGASSLGLRSAESSTDCARDILFLSEHLRRLSSLGQNLPSTIVILRPTSPDRSIGDLFSALTYFRDNFHSIDSIRSVSIATETPYKMWKVNHDTKLMQPILGSLADDNFNSPRQELPAVYWQNGQFDVVKTSNIIQGSLLGDRVYPWITSLRGRDVDSPSDLVS